MTDNKIWEKVRDEFPALKKLVYLNPASSSPISRSAAQEAKGFYEDVLVNGDSNWEQWLVKKEEVREKVAEFINADKEEIAFIPSTSHGMNLVAQMLRGKGEVITMDDEFPATTIPWFNKGFKLHFVKPENSIYPLDSIEEKINEKTRILVTSHIQFSTGFKQDLVELEKLCKKHDLVYVVNATQSAGAMPIDVKKAGIDFLMFSSVKWLMTGMGIGAIYVNKKWHNKVEWPMAGWLSVKRSDLENELNNRDYELKEAASVLEVGAPDFPSIFAFGAAIDLINEVGKENVENRIYELGDYLVEKLKKLNLKIITPLDKKYRTGIIVIKIENPIEVAQQLHRKNILVSARRGGLRISFHIYNNERDIDRFIEALTQIIKT